MASLLAFMVAPRVHVMLHDVEPAVVMKLMQWQPTQDWLTTGHANKCTLPPPWGAPSCWHAKWASLALQTLHK